MPIYRVLKRLDTGHDDGDLVVSGWRRDDVMAELERKECIAEIETPPLDVLPGWQLRFDLLAELGIITIADFIDAPRDDVMDALGIAQERTYRKYRNELMGWLAPETKKTNG